MRLYLKLALMIAVTVLVQAALQPVRRCAWEVQFAARCWMAYQLQDTELRAQLVEEGQQRLVQSLGLRRAWEAELPVATVHAAAGPVPALAREPDSNLQRFFWCHRLGKDAFTSGVND